MRVSATTVEEDEECGHLVYIKTIERIKTMIEKLLTDWPGEVEIDDKHYTNTQDAIRAFKNLSSATHIKLLAKRKSTNKANIEAVSDPVEYRVTVKKYMTEPATPSFDFMAKWNNDTPMPMRIMQGTVEKETRGMIYMKLHGLAKPTITCRCCGKELTNPVSRNYGIGPICLGKLGIARDINDINGISEELVNIEWSGWVIKSAITEKEEIHV